MALASHLLAAYRALPRADQRRFFALLATRFGPDLELVRRAVAEFAQTPDATAAARLHAMAEPRRQELIRRMNLAPGGTSQLVAMREDLLQALQDDRSLAAVDADFRHLFASLFNRGFLALQRIDWSTPAHILEKIIHYEAVHAITSWDDLRLRLEPADRRLDLADVIGGLGLERHLIRERDQPDLDLGDDEFRPGLLVGMVDRGLDRVLKTRTGVSDDVLAV